MDVKLKGIANEDLIQGFPGVPATWPRLAGTVEIRSLPHNANGACTPVEIVKVTVGLYRTDSIVVPSHRPSMASQKREKSFLITRQKEIYRTSTPTKLYGLDVPFTLSLPTKNIPTASISLPKMLESTYNALVSVEIASFQIVNGGQLAGANQLVSYQFPVRIKRFDTLCTFGTYKQRISGSKSSSDHLVSLEWSLPMSAYGPGDTISISLQAQPNRDWPKAQKVKLKRVSVELVQKTKYIVPDESENAHHLINENDPSSSSASVNSFSMSGAANPNSSTSSSALASSTSTQSAPVDIDTRTRLIKVFHDLNSTEQDSHLGMENQLVLDLKVPSFAQSVEKENSILPKEQPWVGYTGRSPFTNQSALYRITFVLVIKARLSHAKDIEAEQELTLSQFDHYACKTYMSNLVEAAQRLKHLDLRPQPPRQWNEPLDTQISII